MAEKTFHSLTLPGQDTARVPSTASEFSTSITYKVKDYCTYQGNLYRCIINHPAGAWNNTHFIVTDIDTEFDRKLDIPIIQEIAPDNPRVGDLWIDNSADTPIYNVDVQPTIGSTNAVQSGGTRTLLNALDSRKLEHSIFTGDFSESVDYRVGDLIFKPIITNGVITRILYRCIEDHNSMEWVENHFIATTLEIELQRLRNNEADVDMIGDLFGAKLIYNIGDYCVYNDNLYKCINNIDNTQISTPAFNHDDWVQVKLADEINNINNIFLNVPNVDGSYNLVCSISNGIKNYFWQRID